MMCIEEMCAIAPAIEIGSNFINETGYAICFFDWKLKLTIFFSVSLPTWILAIAT